MNSKDKVKLVLLGEEHSGRDEMNLAGNPFGLLQAASKAGQSFLRREWKRTLANGRTVNASWEVNGHAELGLPGPNEELLYLALLQIAREQMTDDNQWPETVHFTRNDLLARMKWQNGAKEYKTLNECFQRLQAVTIQAQWSFFDARVGGPIENIGFSLIETFVLHEEKTRRRTKDGELPFSYIRWNSIVHQSLCAGNVRSLALEFTLSLDLPISRRLFRLLELLRNSQRPPKQQLLIEAFHLRDRLGMTPYKYPSQIKQILGPSINELVERGYLKNVEFQKEKKAVLALFEFADPADILLAPQKAQKAPKKPQKQHLPAEQNDGSRRAGSDSESKTGKIEKVKAKKSEMSPTLFNVSGEDDKKLDQQRETITDTEKIRRGYEVWLRLSEREQNTFREKARTVVVRDFWDRLENPNSPISISLFGLVWEKYR